MRRIPLSQGLFARVDDEDFEWVIQEGRWSAHRYASGVCYAMRREDGRCFYMHRMIMEIASDYGIPPNQFINHKDGNGLNNQRRNLEITSLLENTRHYHRNRQRR